MGVCAADPESEAKATPSTHDKQIINFMKMEEKLKNAKPDQLYFVHSMSALSQPVWSNQPSPSRLTRTTIAQATGSARSFLTCSNPDDVDELEVEIQLRKRLQILPNREALLQRIADFLVDSCPKEDRELFLIKDSSTLDSRELEKRCKDKGVTLHIITLPSKINKLLSPLHQLETLQHDVSKQRQQMKIARDPSKKLLLQDLLDLVAFRSKSYRSEDIQHLSEKTRDFLRDGKCLACFGRLCLQDKSDFCQLCGRSKALNK